MFGKILSGLVKVATCHVDIVEGAFDAMTGGDGSKESRKNADMPGTTVRDGICKALEDLDE